MKNNILKYLGYRNIEPDDKINALIDELIIEVKEIAKFKYIYQEYSEIFDFLKKDAYINYLEGSNSYLLVGTTLGIEIDKRIKYYQMIDLTKSIIFDAISSAYIEFLADEFERNLNRDLSFRFCPGYSGTEISDNREIAKIINANKILGITFLESGLMVPQKSMMGIVAVGNKKNRSCKNCLLVKDCKYLRSGVTCYQK